jgi:hypothetical protein
MSSFHRKNQTLCERVMPTCGQVIRAEEVDVVPCLGDLIVDKTHQAAHAAGTSTGNMMCYEDPHVGLIVTRKHRVLGRAISQSTYWDAVRVGSEGRRGRE